MSGSADLHEGIASRWVAAGLNTTFNSLWDVADRTEYTVLNDSEGAPEQPTPFCVFSVEPGFTSARMSDDANGIHEIRDIPVQFRIHTQVVAGDSRSAKEIAKDLLDDVLEHFGGHPTTAPGSITLDNGNFLISQYQNDFGLRTGDDSYLWTINYIMRVDVPVKVS